MLKRKPLSRAHVVLLAIALFGPSPVFGQSAENIAVVINEASAASQRIAEHYIKRRTILPGNVIRIRTVETETIERRMYEATIQQPIAAAIARGNLHDRILYIVLTKGMPLRISGTAGLEGTVSSVDSELTLLYRRMTGNPSPTRGKVNNPYFLGQRPLAEARPFTHRDFDIYLVTRLDAFTVDEAIALIDRAQSPQKDGRFVLDQKNALLSRTGEDWLEEAAKRLRDRVASENVVLETSSQGARGISPALGYYSWGSNDPFNRVRKTEMGFVPGSIAATFVSTDARTFQEPPADWIPQGERSDRKTWFAGSPQSLSGDLIREGATGVAGHVAEPYLQSTIRPEVLFPAYVAGFNLAESFYLAMPHLSWQTIVIGDPLCTPFPRKVPTATELYPSIDPASELPIFFTTRRMEILKRTSLEAHQNALALLLRAESRLARGNKAGARQAFEEAALIAPNLPGVHLQLGVLLDEAAEHDAAIARYRQVLELQPRNPVALNNLAYALAVHKNAPKEAKPLAQKAVALAPRNATVLDTMAWIEYLLSDIASAAKLIAVAVRGVPNNAEVRLHAAFIYAAASAYAAAEVELKAALKLNPELEKRDDVRQLQVLLGKTAR